ncbi:MAG: NnrS family protein [Gammaproteobacteria bacterium]|nr:NnrS family protein [Gammaproteobacteria bacterium]
MQPGNLNVNNPNPQQFALFNLGFRIFFLAAGVFSILSISLWASIYLFQYSPPIQSMSISQWHAHEMIYGYSMAVVAGFLLTAVKNWTGVQTIFGKPLMLLFALWAVARILWLTGTSYLLIAGIFDNLFILLLFLAVSHPVIKVKQWKQLAVLSKILLLLLFNVLFYLGAFGILDQGIYWGLYGGLYLIIALIFTMGRRVLPFFIEMGVGYPVKLFNSKWLDISSLVFLLLFFIIELFFNIPWLSAGLAMGVFIVNAIRLVAWHTPGIWKTTLLWSLYIPFWFITVGFLLLACSYFFGISMFLAIHALAFGGIGALTMSMMSRVSLGHTGRDISSPPPIIGYALGILLLGAFFRVVVPLFVTQYYTLWIGLSQLLWIIAFLIYTVTYLPMFTKPRIDGQPG